MSGAVLRLDEEQERVMIRKNSRPNFFVRKVHKTLNSALKGIRYVFVISPQMFR